MNPERSWVLRTADGGHVATATSRMAAEMFAKIDPRGLVVAVVEYERDANELG